MDAHGVRWVVESDRLAELQRVAAALAEPGLRPLHQIPSRAHFRIVPAHPPARAAFVKRYSLLGWPRRLRHLIRPLPAAVEWTVARTLAPHGLAAVVPWAWGQRLRCGIPVECYLVADDLGDLPTLEQWVPRRRSLPRPAFRAALAGLAQTLRRLHDLGYFHGDPHQRNIIPLEAPDGLRWTFLDFQQARRARITAPYRRVRDLGRVFHAVRLELGRTERARLLRAYVAAGSRLPRRLFRMLELIVLYYEFRLLRRRARRCLTVGEHFRVSTEGPFTVRHCADADVRRIAALLRQIPDASPPGAAGATHRCADSSLAVRVLPARGGQAWVTAHGLVARGLPTPTPLAWARDGGRGIEYLVTANQPVAVPLQVALKDAGGVPEMTGLLRAAGVALRRLHDCGGRHRAVCPGLLAVRDAAVGAGGWTVLFERPEDLVFRPWVSRRDRRREVGRLAGALARAAPGLPEEAWRGFLQAYLPPGFAAARAVAFRRPVRRRARPAP